MAAMLTGGCQCGAVRYTLLALPRDVYWCHCRMCQRAVGGPAAAFVNVAKTEIVFAGDPAYHASSAIGRRGFCAQCGTPISFDYPDAARIDISLGSLDDATGLVPHSHFGVESHLPGWIALGDLPVQRADDYPPLAERWAAAQP
jgi:hypothetical protein